ncbi:hypothetical protein GCM10012275_64690 [Longimycelium tulufanense]|uniref:Uncharacterized protein n=1 Tax=Longimycelium tulufanense TaxID=907463 RepID=A0A8J3CEY2_9PSEU|nr:hypothetical protein [Longimycelium tulufanense]GGM84985.1 hypothetical protein GCM10012275_64690 [Longimycelium tulufanense]
MSAPTVSADTTVAALRQQLAAAQCENHLLRVQLGAVVDHIVDTALIGCRNLGEHQPDTAEQNRIAERVRTNVMRIAYAATQTTRRTIHG